MIEDWRVADYRANFLESMDTKVLLEYSGEKSGQIDRNILFRRYYTEYTRTDEGFIQRGRGPIIST